MKRWEDADPLAGLTIVEREIVADLLDGLTLRAIGERRGWAAGTAKELAGRAAGKLAGRFKGKPVVRLVQAGTEARLRSLLPLATSPGRDAA